MSSVRTKKSTAYSLITEKKKIRQLKDRLHLAFCLIPLLSPLHISPHHNAEDTCIQSPHLYLEQRGTTKILSFIAINNRVANHKLEKLHLSP